MLLETTPLNFLLYLGPHNVNSHGMSEGMSGGKMFLLASIPVAFAMFYFIYLAYSRGKIRNWENGFFPPNLKFDRDNLMEAYICLAAFMIQKDTNKAGEKVVYMNQYFSRHFKDSFYNFSDSLTWSYKNPIKVSTVAFWLNKNIRDTGRKSQVLYFLAGIAMVDGQMIDREYAILKEITTILGLSQKDLDAIMATYQFKKEEKQTHQSNSERQTSNGSQVSYRVEMAYKVLGVPIGSTIIEIKSAYRKMVKVHHPDRFANESQDQIKLAHERFCKIQDAYELLEKLKG